MAQKSWDIGSYEVGNRELETVQEILLQLIGNRYDFEFFVDEACSALHVQLEPGSRIGEAELESELQRLLRSRQVGLKNVSVTRL